MLQVCDPVLSESLTLVVDKRADGASQRHYRHRGRRLETRNQPQQVGNQNEKRQGHQEGRIAFAVVPDNFLTLSLDETVGALKNVL